MTTEELRALIAECEDPDKANSYLRMPDLADLARDALRFRWLMESGDYYGTRLTIHWTGEGRSVRDAIDADMGDGADA